MLCVDGIFMPDIIMLPILIALLRIAKSHVSFIQFVFVEGANQRIDKNQKEAQTESLRIGVGPCAFDYPVHFVTKAGKG